MAGSSWTASIGSLSVGGTSTCEIALAVLPDAGATLTNVASVSGGQADPNPLNNSPSAETRVAQVLLKALTFYDLGIDLSARFDGGGGEAGGQPLDLAPTEAEWLDVEPDGVAERNLPVAFTKGARGDAVRRVRDSSTAHRSRARRDPATGAASHSREGEAGNAIRMGEDCFNGSLTNTGYR